jgi:hypothetical protein
MTATNHAVFGAFVAAVVPNPIIAPILALLSHFVLDSLPHFDFRKKNPKAFAKLLVIDGFLASIFLLSILFIRPLHWQLLLVCALLAISPDLMWLPGYVRQLKKMPQKAPSTIMKLHAKIQWAEFNYGLAVEIPWLVFFLWAFIASEM